MACFSLAREQALPSRMVRRESGNKEDRMERRAGQSSSSALPAAVRPFKSELVHRLDYFST